MSVAPFVKTSSIVKVINPKLSMKMDQIQCLDFIPHLKKTCLSPKAIFKDMVKTYGEDTPSYTMIEKRSAEFRSGRDSIQYDPHPGRLATDMNQDAIAKVCDLVMAD